MTLLTLSIYIAAIASMLGVMVAFLPSGVEHPLPTELVEATQTLYSWLLSFNEIFPVDTLMQVLVIGVFAKFLMGFVWPAVLWLFNGITGAGR